MQPSQPHITDTPQATPQAMPQDSELLTLHEQTAELLAQALALRERILQQTDGRPMWQAGRMESAAYAVHCATLSLGNCDDLLKLSQQLPLPPLPPL